MISGSEGQKKIKPTNHKTAKSTIKSLAGLTIRIIASGRILNINSKTDFKTNSNLKPMKTKQVRQLFLLNNENGIKIICIRLRC